MIPRRLRRRPSRLKWAISVPGYVSDEHRDVLIEAVRRARGKELLFLTGDVTITRLS